MREKPAIEGYFYESKTGKEDCFKVFSTAYVVINIYVAGAWSKNCVWSR